MGKTEKVRPRIIKRSYNRVLEKTKDIRQNFTNAVTTSRQSGSGKIVMEFHEELVKLWGRSPATKSLTLGISLNSVSSNIPNNNTSPVNSYASSTPCSSKSSPSPASENEVQHDSSSGYVHINSS